MQQRSHNSHSLSILDAIAIIIGIVIGPGIFEVGPSVAQSFSNVGDLVSIWLLGGVLSFAGVLCYAELTARYPSNAGEYVWLKEAFHPRLANTFLWAEVAIIRPGAIAAMAFPAATYLHACIPHLPVSQTITAACIVLITTMVNLCGLRASRLTQNILSSVKILALGAIIVTGLIIANTSVSAEPSTPRAVTPDYGLALILVLFTFGGWNEIANVTADVRGGARSVYTASIIALTAITTLYVSITIAYVHLLGMSQFSASTLPVVTGLQAVVPGSAVTVVSLLISVACFGAIQGMLFSGARMYDRFLTMIPHLTRIDTPHHSLSYLLQLLLSIVIIFVAGTFSQAVVYTTTIVWLCFLLRGLCVPILRAKHGPPSALATPLYPIPVIVFCASCIFLIWSACTYSPWGTAIAACIASMGLLVVPKSPR